MDVLYVGEPAVSVTLPWPYKSQEGKYNNFYDKIDENPGQWVIFTLTEGAPTERVRSAVLSHYRKEGVEVKTSANGRRFAAKRVR